MSRAITTESPTPRTPSRHNAPTWTYALPLDPLDTPGRFLRHDAGAVPAHAGLFPPNRLHPGPIAVVPGCGAAPAGSGAVWEYGSWSPRVWDCLPFRAQRRSRRTADPALPCCSQESIWRVHIPGRGSNVSGAPGRMPRQRLPEKSHSGQASRCIERRPIRSGAT